LIFFTANTRPESRRLHGSDHELYFRQKQTEIVNLVDKMQRSPAFCPAIEVANAQWEQALVWRKMLELHHT